MSFEIFNKNKTIEKNNNNRKIEIMLVCGVYIFNPLTKIYQYIVFMWLTSFYILYVYFVYKQSPHKSYIHNFLVLMGLF